MRQLTRRLHAEHHETTLDSGRAGFALAIPSGATPDFATSAGEQYPSRHANIYIRLTLRAYLVQSSSSGVCESRSSLYRHKPRGIYLECQHTLQHIRKQAHLLLEFPRLFLRLLQLLLHHHYLYLHPVRAKAIVEAIDLILFLEARIPVFLLLARRNLPLITSYLFLLFIHINNILHTELSRIFPSYQLCSNRLIHNNSNRKILVRESFLVMVLSKTDQQVQEEVLEQARRWY